MNKLNYSNKFWGEYSIQSTQTPKAIRDTTEVNKILSCFQDCSKEGNVSFVANSQHWWSMVQNRPVILSRWSKCLHPMQARNPPPQFLILHLFNLTKIKHKAKRLSGTAVCLMGSTALASWQREWRVKLCFCRSETLKCVGYLGDSPTKARGGERGCSGCTTGWGAPCP